MGGQVCGAGPFNCHIVTGSVWGTLLWLPLPVWGLIAYSGILGSALLAKQGGDWPAHGLRLVALAAAVLLLADAFLLGVQVFALRNYCLLCLITYGVNGLLLVAASRGLGQPVLVSVRSGFQSLGRLAPAPTRPETGLFLGLMALSVAGAVGLHLATLFATRGTLGGFKKQISEYIAGRPRVTVDVSGDPAQGQADAPIQLVEFSDFFCPACQRASKMNPVLLETHRGKIHFVFKNFPLDMSCNTAIQRDVHPGACQAAAAGECAHAQGKFWPMHDRIFVKGHEYDLSRLNQDAQEVGLDVATFKACMAGGAGMAQVAKDVAAGDQAGVTSTPTYVINGVPAGGGLTPSTLDDFIDALEQR